MRRIRFFLTLRFETDAVFKTRSVNQRRQYIANDDLDVIGNSLSDTANALRKLERTTGKIGLKQNASKIKVMESIDNGVNRLQRKGLTFEKLKEFKHLKTSKMFNLKG